MWEGKESRRIANQNSDFSSLFSESKLEFQEWKLASHHLGVAEDIMQLESREMLKMFGVT